MMIATPSAPDLVALALWLAEARAAYHALMTGKMFVEVSIDGGVQVTKFARPDAPKLLAYITRLEGQVASAGRPQRGPGAIGIDFV